MRMLLSTHQPGFGHDSLRRVLKTIRLQGSLQIPPIHLITTCGPTLIERLQNHQ